MVREGTHISLYGFDELVEWIFPRFTFDDLTLISTIIAVYNSSGYLVPVEHSTRTRVHNAQHVSSGKVKGLQCPYQGATGIQGIAVIAMFVS